MSTQIELLVPNWLAIVINLSKSREKYLSADWFYNYSSIGSKSFSDSIVIYVPLWFQNTFQNFLSVADSMSRKWSHEIPKKQKLLSQFKKTLTQLYNLQFTLVQVRVWTVVYYQTIGSGQSNDKNLSKFINFTKLKMYITERKIKVRYWNKKCKKPTAPSVPRRSPIQVLTRLNVA